MNQRVHNLSKWRFLAEGELLHFGVEKARTVILEVNAPDEVRLYVCQSKEAVERSPERLAEQQAGRWVPPIESDEEGPLGGKGFVVTFVGLARGRERFEFAVDGAFDLCSQGGSVYVFSADGQDIATRIAAPIIYTRIANRRQRNPHMEMMEYQMRLNQERLQAVLVEEAERRINALERRLESYAPQRDQRAPPERTGRAPGELDGIGKTGPAAGSPPSPEGGASGGVPAAGGAAATP